MVDLFHFQLWEGTALPAEWLNSPCLGQIWFTALMTLAGPKWVWDSRVFLN